MTFPFQESESSPEGSGSLPDINTSEAILYGPAYFRIKSMLWAWDEMEDYLLKKADSLESQIMDREWCYEVMRYNRYLIFARSPPVNDVSKLRDLFTLRSLCKCVAGLRKIDEYRKQNKAWARMKGTENYVKGMEGRGISESEWKAATASYNNEPITYDYVHGLKPSMIPGEVFDWNEAMRDLMGGKEFDSLVQKIFGVDVSEVPLDEGERAAEPPEPPSPKEPDHNLDDLTESLRIMFPDPVEEAKNILSKDTDECSACADYWHMMDIDDISLVEQLIQYAEAM